LLAETAAHIGDQQVRNKGTIGGSLAHADPASDLPAAVLALDGVFHITGPDGLRQVNAADFFVDLLMTALQEDEILTTIEVKTLGANTGSAYLKFEHPASGYAICGAAAIVELNDDGSCKAATLCFNGVAAMPFKVEGLSAALAGGDLADSAIDEAVAANLSVADPMQDIHASGPYRVELAKVYGKRALKLARDRAKG
jgi:carbon-monoxide dehydrogenase medium subunit